MLFNLWRITIHRLYRMTLEDQDQSCHNDLYAQQHDHPKGIIMILSINKNVKASQLEIKPCICLLMNKYSSRNKPMVKRRIINENIGKNKTSIDGMLQ